jgi:hypothetical protein
MMTPVMRIREDLSLTFAALRSLNGANIHEGTGLIAAYQQAVEVAANPRTPKAIMPAAVAHVVRCEVALRHMAGARALSDTSERAGERAMETWKWITEDLKATSDTESS